MVRRTSIIYRRPSGHPAGPDLASACRASRILEVRTGLSVPPRTLAYWRDSGLLDGALSPLDLACKVVLMRRRGLSLQRIRVQLAREGVGR